MRNNGKRRLTRKESERILSHVEKAVHFMGRALIFFGKAYGMAPVQKKR